MPNDGQIDYIELPAADIAGAKRFYAQAFGWRFNDYGPGYAGFLDGRGGEREAGGFNAERKPATKSGPLVVLYAADLAAMEKKVTAAGGAITDRHEFPGGKRFHFRDPGGNEIAVWSDQ